VIRKEDMNRLLKVCLVSALFVSFVFSALPSNTTADDEGLILYTEYTEYENNESVKYFIVGTNNTTYQLFLFHRDSSSPLVVAYARTDNNSTTTNGSIGLYEIESFGWLTLTAQNESNNESAKTTFKLTPSPDWWREEVDRLIASVWQMILTLLYIIAAAFAIPTFIGVALLISYRDKVKAASGELTISERMKLEDLWNYDDYANDVCARNPHSPSERARLKYSTARTLFFDLVAAKKKLGLYRQLEEKEKELKARMPRLVNDVLDALVNEEIITEKERKEMTGKERFNLLNPGQKKVEL
jgi:hypothetical protein